MDNSGLSGLMSCGINSRQPEMPTDFKCFYIISHFEKKCKCFHEKISLFSQKIPVRLIFAVSKGIPETFFSASKKSDGL